MNALTQCPNCQSHWGFDEMQWEQCDCCGYPNCDDEMDEQDIDESHCIECGKEIKISEEASEVKDKNGISCFRWMDEDQEYTGGICWDCASKLCDEGKGSICGGGGLAPDFCYI